MKAVILFCITLLFCTCTKLGENIYVKGKVNNPVTGKGIPGVEIALQKKTTFEYATGFKPVEIGKTDANGEFEIRHLGGFKQYYLNSLYSSSYFPIGWYVNGEFVDSYLTKIKKGKQIEATFHMVPFSNLKFHYKNLNCFNNEDSIKLFFDGEEIDSKSFLNGLISSLNGCIDIYGNERQITIGKKYFHWISIKNGITEIFYDTIIVKENELAILEVLF